MFLYQNAISNQIVNTVKKTKDLQDKISTTEETDERVLSSDYFKSSDSQVFGKYWLVCLMNPENKLVKFLSSG